MGYHRPMSRPEAAGHDQPARIEIHPDFQVLEERLAELLRHLNGAGPAGFPAPALVVAPTRRLLSYLQEVLADRIRAGLLNVRFLHHDGLAQAIAAQAGIALPSPLGNAVKESIVEHLARQSGGELSEFVDSRPGSVTALLSTMEDLRESGVDPDAASAVGGLSLDGQAVVRLYRTYASMLTVLGRQGWSDRAGHILSALPHAAAYARRFRLVIHYGAYELIGVNLDLMRALECERTPVIYIAPGHPTAPAYAHAARFWTHVPGNGPILLSGVSRAGTDIGAEAGAGAVAKPARSGLLGDRLTRLYDEEAAPPLEQRRLDLVHAQGAAAELREAALRILARHRDHGTPLLRMAIIARTLEPYAAHLKPVFLEHGLPFHTTASMSAAREPRVQAALLLARCLRDDFPAGPLFDLLRSGLFQGPGDPARSVDAWERLARRYRVAGGSALWVDHLPRWSAGDASREDRHRQAERLAALVRGLVRQAAKLQRARTWVDWAEGFRSLLARTIDGYQGWQAPAWTEEEAHDPGVTLMEGLLYAIESLQYAKVPFTSTAAFEHLESAVAGATIPIGSVAADGSAARGDQGGVRVLDAMQARGLAFDAVILVGMNADLFPRRGREDPFLTDDDRRRIRTALRRPLPVAAEAKDEERLLLALLLGSAREQLAVSWQRADESGKARVPALALREIARIALATTDLVTAERRALTIGAHPADQARSAVERHALLASREAARAIALLAGGPRPAEALLGQPAVAALGVDRDATLPGLGLLAVIEGTWTTPFDALPGEAGRPQDAWSPSRLERLGSCPQHFFFRHVLRASEWDEPAAPYEFEAREMGALAHEVLRDVYSALVGEGLLTGGPGRLDEIVRRAEMHLEAAWARRAAPLAVLSRALYPALWDLTADHWIASLKRFLRLDLAEVLAAGRVLDGFEVEVVRAIPLGTSEVGSAVPPGLSGPALAVRGRFDRTGRDPDGAIVVSDYKTSGALERHVGLTEMLKGSRLQMGLYALMAEPDLATPGAPETHPGRPEVRAEVLGVGPRYADEEAEGGGPARAGLDPVEFASIREGLLETLHVLASLAERGLFPLNEKSRVCPYCPFTRACRRTHRPTLERLAANADLRQYFMTLMKNSRSPRLPGAGTGGRLR